MSSHSVPAMGDSRRDRSKRTALVLLSIALAFFLGIMMKVYLFGK